MGMQCKQCGESFPKNQPYDLFELRRHNYLPSDAEGTMHNDMMVDGGTFCSRKCLGDYLKSSDKSGLMDLGTMRNQL
jgi:hypothetical protein